MARDVKDAIETADHLIDTGQYKSAWETLLPYKEDNQVSKRLRWLKAQRNSTQQSGSTVRSKNNATKSYVTQAVIGMAVVLGLIASVLIISQLFNSYNSSSNQDTANGDLAVARPLSVEVTEDPIEADLQQQMREWLSSVPEVDEVSTLDIDNSSGEPPIIYVEFRLTSEPNDDNIPNLLLNKMSETLNTSTYGDFTIILITDTQAVEYSLDLTTNEWNKNTL